MMFGLTIIASMVSFILLIIIQEYFIRWNLIYKLIQVVSKNNYNFDPLLIRKNSERFSIKRFKKEFKDFVEKAVNSHYDNVNN